MTMFNPKPLEGTFVDKAGREITFVYHRDCARENRGFLEDMVVAWNGDEKVGYIRCEYFSPESFSTFNPTIYNFITNMTGKSILPYGEASRDPRKGDAALFTKMAQSMIGYRMAHGEVTEEITSYRKFQSWVKENAFARSMNEAKAAMKEFRKRIDFPFVSYVNVQETRHHGILRDNSNLGIGTELYRQMALELNERGLILRSSTLQSEHAVRVWESFERKGWVAREGKRFRILVDKLGRVAEPNPSTMTM